MGPPATEVPDDPCQAQLVMNSRGRRDSTAETNLRKERQMEGIAKAKAAGVYKGRPPSVDGAKVQQL